MAKIRQIHTNSPTLTTKAVVGEIDTSPPFQSVKDAISLFGEGAFSGEKPAIIKKAKPYSAERALAKETQLHLALKELHKLKEQLKNAEATKAQALVELEKSKRAVEVLTQKLKALNLSRELSIKEIEASKSQTKQLQDEKCGDPDATGGAWKEELETSVQRYASVISELDAAKQELRKTSQEFDSALELKLSAFKQAAEAEDAMKANTERTSELSKEILDVQESNEQMKKLSSIEAHQQQAEIVISEQDVLMRQSYKAALEESNKNLLSLENEFSPELTENLEAQLMGTADEIETLQKEMENKKRSALDSVKSVTLELDGAKESLLKVAEKESSLRSLVEALQAELENVKREHSLLMEKESETESIVGNLHVKLLKSNYDLEMYLAEESKARGATEEMIATLNQLSSETENARCEVEDMKNKAMELKMEAEVTKLALEDAEIKLKVALEEVEAAKAAEAKALDQIRVLSERTSYSARRPSSTSSEYEAKVTISREEFESLSRKAEESDKLADMKVDAAKAQVEALKAGESEALKRLEATQKEIEDMKTATEEALKMAEMAEAAKRVVESELTRWREREQKKAAETAARILAEAQKYSSESSSQQHCCIQPQNLHTKTGGSVRKLEKEKVSASKKVLLPSISSIFHRKKNHQVEGGSLSYLPGENPV